ncbi:MAG: sensor histidine kinase [Candidatus Hydrogenedentes bacterium]|nr:sensor histidine kinase [Candidatus Hydrogenedentota bacterium]
MAAAYDEWATSRAKAVPENVRFLRGAILLSMTGAFAIELAARFLRDQDAISALASKSLSMISIMLLCSAALYLIYLLDGRVGLKAMVSCAAATLFLSQLLSMSREVPVWAHPTLTDWSNALEGPLLLTGIVLLLTTFYIGLLETVSVKALLRKQQLELYHEIAERERAQSELSESRDQLRQLSGHVESIRENDRARMAREIHDELGQTLTSLKIDLDALKRRIAPSAASLPGCIEIIDTMKSQVATTVQTTRRLMTELHPAILEDLGLQAAIEWLVFDFSRRTGIRCSFEAAPDTPVPGTEQATALFRVVQECLTNVIRHANATSVKVKLKSDQGKMSVEVADNGTGFSFNGRKEGKFGILGMKERLVLLNGELEINSSPARGTRILAIVPM